MDTKQKSNSVVGMTRDGSRITFSVRGAGSVTIDTDKLSAANKLHAMYHGIGQKVSNRTAITRNPATGLPASPAFKLSRMVEIVKFLETPDNDEWNLARGTGTAPRTSDRALLGRVLIKLGRKLRVELSELSADQIRALLARSEFKSVADDLRAEDVTDVDTESLLDDLSDDDSDDPDDAEQDDSDDGDDA